MAKRITNAIERPQKISLTVNGKTVYAHPGETIATVLLAENIKIFYRTGSDQPRAPFCNMGSCFECRVKLARTSQDADSTWVRACMILAEEGMTITTAT